MLYSKMTIVDTVTIISMVDIVYELVNFQKQLLLHTPMGSFQLIKDDFEESNRLGVKMKCNDVH